MSRIKFYTPCWADSRSVAYTEARGALNILGQLTSRILDKENSSHCEREHGVGETFHHCPLPSFEMFQHILSSSTFAHYSARMPADPPREYVSEYEICLLFVGGI
jgi:hypothetical protein